MDEAGQDLYAEPPSIRADAGLRQLRETLDGLLAATAPPPAAPSGEEARGCTLLRRRLAVRGWVAPLLLMKEVAEDERDGVLKTVSQEVELAERTRPGKWFMTLTARKRMFLSAQHALLRDASAVLIPDDETDPVRLALLIALDPATTDADSHAVLDRLQGQPSAVLQELARMVAWGASIPGLEALAAAAGAQVQRQARDRELLSVASVPIFGRGDQQVRIRAFLLRPANPQQVRTLYVSGIGGSGKSTLLMSAERELRAQGRSLVVRLDFDNPYLDARSLEQMDILFLRALVVEEPQLAPAMQQVIQQLHSLAESRTRARIDAQGEVQSSSSSRTTLRRVQQVRRAKYATKSGTGAEGAGISEGYERVSALTPVSYLPEFRQRGVVLFLDTLENIGRLGADAIDSALQWLSSIAACVPGRNLQLVLAGRDTLGSPDMTSLASRLRDWDLLLEPDDIVDLGDLDEDAAHQMLEHLGMPPADAALAAATLPLNPLVLRLAADAYGASEADVAAIQRDYRAGRIDRATAGSYLAQRVIQHVPRQPARRYVVAAMALTEITERLLRDIVIPVVDGTQAAADRKLAKKVYEGLKQATWLTVEDMPGSLRWHTELRRLALPMIEADPEYAQIAGGVHNAATAWHERQRAPGSNAKAAYHLASAEKRPWVEHILELAATPFSQFSRYLPQDSAGPVERVAAAPSSGPDDELHRLRVEGFGATTGEGERLVAQGRAARALALYRERPTRAAGIPPTFVIRAMSQTGDWHQGDVDAQRVLDELHAHFTRRGNHMQQPMVERLYWLTRLEMLRGHQLPRPHVELLRDICRSLKFNSQNGAFFGLVGMAEALQSVQGAVGNGIRNNGSWGTLPLSLIAPANWPPPRAAVGPELRFSMVRTAYGQLKSDDPKGRWISSTLGAMILLDERWPELLIRLNGEEALSMPEASYLVWELPKRMQQLRDQSLAQVEQFVASCRDVKVRLNLARIAPRDAVVLMRGNLVEFHTPLSTLLSADALWGANYADDRLLSRLMRFVERLALPPSVILPLQEFQSAQRRQNQSRNLQAATSAVVVMLDRANALAAFGRELALSPSELFDGKDEQAVKPVLELIDRYLAWDRALNPVQQPKRQNHDP